MPTLYTWHKQADSGVSQAQPHLKAHGDEDMWAIWVGEELESNPMFGKVERHGKVRIICSSHPTRTHSDTNSYL